MSRPAQIVPSDLTLRFQIDGPVTAQALAGRLSVDRSTVSRALSRLGDSVVALGAARRSRYALRRAVRTIGDRWPVHRIDAAGRARAWAQVEALHGGYRVTWAEVAPAWAERIFDREGFVDGVPFFLTDLRLQGFLGRREAQRVTDALGVPADPQRWSDDDTIVFLQAEGVDLPGDLILGEASLRRLLARQLDPATSGALVTEAIRANRYPELALQVATSGLPGSSAGGEQPKFLAAVQRADGTAQPVLVKFSPPLDSTAGRRWADLLTAEAHALTLLAEHGRATAGARLIDAGNRRFLEVIRHDRVGAHGRSGVVSLEALHGALPIGHAGNWPDAVVALERAGWLDAATVDNVRRLHFFGELIGNSDMHFGNLAFQLGDALPLHLAPAYDMLPMAWAPNAHGEVVERPFAPRPPVPAELPAWREAAGWAAEFWGRVANDGTISRAAAARARDAGAVVARMREHFAA